MLREYLFKKWITEWRRENQVDYIKKKKLYKEGLLGSQAKGKEGEGLEETDKLE